MPVTLIATWTVRAGKEDEFIEYWRRATADIRADEGLRRSRLHRSRSRPNEFINVAVWESVDHNQACITSGTLRQHRDWLDAHQAGPDPILEGTVKQEWLDLVTESAGGSGSMDFR